MRNGAEKVIDGYREEKGEVHATLDCLKAAGLQVKAGLSALRDGKLQQEGEDGQQVCVCVVERELHEQSLRPEKPQHTEISGSLWMLMHCKGASLIQT